MAKAKEPKSNALYIRLTQKEREVLNRLFEKSKTATTMAGMIREMIYMEAVSEGVEGDMEPPRGI